MLNITLIQTDIYWQDITANLSYLEEKIFNLSGTDLIVLPEMFPTGFTMDTHQFAQPINMTVIKWLVQMAKQTNACIIGSYAVSEAEKYYNRLIVMYPDGKYFYYDKKHLFRMGDEHLHYTAGVQRIIVDIKGWKICPLICYDLRFPVWSRNTPPYYDLLLYVANFPSSSAHVWQTLLQARAIENWCYTVGVNRVGTDGRDIAYSGNSMIVNYKGEITAQAGEVENIIHFTLDKTALTEFRNKFPAYLDADKFTI
jgi:predicted amidohydrolase